MSGHRRRQDRGTPLPFSRRVSYWRECWLPELNHPLTQIGALCPMGEHYSSGTRGTRLCVRGKCGSHSPLSETRKSSLLEFQLFGQTWNSCPGQYPESSSSLFGEWVGGHPSEQREPQTPGLCWDFPPGQPTLTVLVPVRQKHFRSTGSQDLNGLGDIHGESTYGLWLPSSVCGGRPATRLALGIAHVLYNNICYRNVVANVCSEVTWLSLCLSFLVYNVEGSLDDPVAPSGTKSLMH